MAANIFYYGDGFVNLILKMKKRAWKLYFYIWARFLHSKSKDSMVVTM